MDLFLSFEDFKINCPWLGAADEGYYCKGGKTHDGDKYLTCTQRNCAPLHFAKVLKTKLQITPKLVQDIK